MLLSKSQNRVLVEKVAILPETDREPVLDAFRDELSLHRGQVSDKDFLQALQIAIDAETTGQSDAQGPIPLIRIKGMSIKDADAIYERSKTAGTPAWTQDPRRVFCVVSRLPEPERSLFAEFTRHSGSKTEGADAYGPWANHLFGRSDDWPPDYVRIFWARQRVPRFLTCSWRFGGEKPQEAPPRRSPLPARMMRAEAISATHAPQGLRRGIRADIQALADLTKYRASRISNRRLVACS